MHYLAIPSNHFPLNAANWITPILAETFSCSCFCFSCFLCSPVTQVQTVAAIVAETSGLWTYLVSGFSKGWQWASLLWVWKYELLKDHRLYRISSNRVNTLTLPRLHASHPLAPRLSWLVTSTNPSVPGCRYPFVSQDIKPIRVGFKSWPGQASVGETQKDTKRLQEMIPCGPNLCLLCCCSALWSRNVCTELWITVLCFALELIFFLMACWS